MGLAARITNSVVCEQVASVAEAMKAAEAGVDAIIAQGVEAGGHVQGLVKNSFSIEIPIINLEILKNIRSWIALPNFDGNLGIQQPLLAHRLKNRRRHRSKLLE